MVQIPENTVTISDLNEWFRLQLELKKVKAAEMLLRARVARAFFPTPKEGTNSFNLPDGYVLKCKHVINRSVDVAAFTVMKEQFREAGFNPDNLVNYKPELATSVYRELTEEQMQLFDQCLTVKEGSPSLEIVLPKKAKNE